MRKIYKISFGLFLLIIGILILFNFRYSFYTIQGGGWSIGTNALNNIFRDNPVKNSDIYHFDWLKEQSNQTTKFLADPFIYIENDIHYIFFEHQAKGNANIGLLKSMDGKNYSFEGDVLDEDFHLSFPQVFKYKKDYYMLPETKQAGHILLYKAEDFPSGWKIYDTLIKEVSFKDPAIFISDTLNLISISDDSLKQTIYSADSLTGIWQKDPRFKDRYGDETRAGGNFFNVGGELFLPLQKNNRGYGSGVSIYKLRKGNNEIKLEKYIDGYLDKIDTIPWFNRGMHHLSVFPYKNEFKIVFDGDIKNLKEEKIANWKASLKYNYYDIINYFKN